MKVVLKVYKPELSVEVGRMKVVLKVYKPELSVEVGRMKVVLKVDLNPILPLRHLIYSRCKREPEKISLLGELRGLMSHITIKGIEARGSNPRPMDIAGFLPALKPSVFSYSRCWRSLR